MSKKLTITVPDDVYQGLHAVMLYVDADNIPAVSLYRRLGFTRWDVDVMYAPLEER